MSIFIYRPCFFYFWRGIQESLLRDPSLDLEETGLGKKGPRAKAMAKYALGKTVAWAERTGQAGKAGQQLGHRIQKLVYKSPSLNTDRPSWTVHIPYRKADGVETAILLTLFLHRVDEKWETLPQYDDTDEKWTFTTPENLLDAHTGGHLDGFSLKHHETCINVLSHVACRILGLPMDEGTRTQAVRIIRKVVQNPAIRSDDGRTGSGGSSKPCLIRRNGLYTNEAFSFSIRRRKMRLVVIARDHFHLLPGSYATCSIKEAGDVCSWTLEQVSLVASSEDRDDGSTEADAGSRVEGD